MSFVPIAITCNGPLEAAHVSIDDDRYHTMLLNVALLAGPRPKLDLSDPTWSSSSLFKHCFYVSYLSVQRSQTFFLSLGGLMGL